MHPGNSNVQRIKTYSLFILFFFIMAFSSTGQESTIEEMSLYSVSVTDLSNVEQTVFSTGDYIRYVFDFTLNFPSAVFLRGSVVFENAEKENLDLQFQTVRAGEHRFIWDSVIPDKAMGNAEVTFTYLGIPSGFRKETALFTVTEREGEGLSLIHI